MASRTVPIPAFQGRCCPHMDQTWGGLHRLLFYLFFFSLTLDHLLREGELKTLGSQAGREYLGSVCSLTAPTLSGWNENLNHHLSAQAGLEMFWVNKGSRKYQEVWPTPIHCITSSRKSMVQFCSVARSKLGIKGRDTRWNHHGCTVTQKQTFSNLCFPQIWI